VEYTITTGHKVAGTEESASDVMTITLGDGIPPMKVYFGSLPVGTLLPEPENASDNCVKVP
jgi:hypothetical protein